MVYLDTSFLAPLILNEQTSVEVEHFIVSLTPATLAISQWTRVEFSSLLARRVRMGGLATLEARAAEAQFDAVIDETFTVYAPTVDDFDLAKDYLRNHETGLRAGDALHLAIAKNRAAEAIYSLDKGMLRAGETLGLPTYRGITSGV